MKKMNVLIIHDGTDPLPPEESFDTLSRSADWGTEIAVYRALKNRGHAVRFTGFYDDIVPLVGTITQDRPDIVFNLAEGCLGEYHHDHNLPAFLELMNLPYTGCSPLGLMTCNNKAMAKKILTYHNINVPLFSVYKMGERVQLPRVFSAPYFVKPLREEASVGIAQRSLALNEAQCRERVSFVHERLQKDALVEEFIQGRELYVGVLGHGKQVRVLPPWELKFAHSADGDPRIATYRVKWDDAYRKKWGIRNEHADPLPAGVAEKITDICVKAYRVLNIDGYIRFDLRLTPAGEVYIIEANANPELAPAEDFAASAARDGLPYEALIEHLLHQGLQRKN
jgi:D-alanine-D-alanine ligase